jgi:hypothetical protein
MELRPIDRIVRWFERRQVMAQRPSVPMPCGDCGEMVGPDDGAWSDRWRMVACSDECAFGIQADHF